MVRSPEERQFFVRLYRISYGLQIGATIALVNWLRSPVTGLEWLVFFAIMFCLGRLVATIVTVVGFRFWQKAFGHKYSE